MDSRLLWGMVDMLLLDVVARGPTYGYEIAQTLAGESKGYFELKEGSMYPALHRLEGQALLSSYWVDTPDGRRRKYYRSTPAGQKSLRRKREEWSRFAEGVQGVLGCS